MTNIFLRHLPIACLILSSTIAVADSEFSVWKGPSFRATQVVYDAKSPSEAQKGNVYVSKDGLKMITGGIPGPNGMRASSMVVIVKGIESYLVIPDLKLYIDQKSGAGGTKMEVDNVTGIFSPAPCLNFKYSHSLGVVTLNQRQMEKWRCGNQPGVGDVIHYMDKELKCVVRSESGTGHIVELRDVALVAIPKDTFDIPKDYHKGTMNDLFQNPQSLPAYKKDK